METINDLNYTGCESKLTRRGVERGVERGEGRGERGNAVLHTELQ